jgi:type I restriction enzyme S subunit
MMGREHWIEIPFSDTITALESGSRPKGGVKGITEGIPSIGAEHLNSEGTFNFTNLRYVPFEFADRMNRGKIDFNDILVVKDGATTGKVSIVNNDFPYKVACVNEHVFICRLIKNINVNYCFFFLRSHVGQEQIMSSFHGGAQGGINSEFVHAISIPLPPLKEQKRIVEKLDALLPRVKSAKARLKKIPVILKKFRQSVLAAACSGKLTEDWREKQDPS